MAAPRRNGLSYREAAELIQQLAEKMDVRLRSLENYRSRAGGIALVVSALISALVSLIIGIIVARSGGISTRQELPPIVLTIVPSPAAQIRPDALILAGPTPGQSGPPPGPTLRPTPKPSMTPGPRDPTVRRMLCRLLEEILGPLQACP